MGSKNRIFLGIISSNISHFIRNTFSKKVYMTDSTVKKIENKHHPLENEFIYNHNFQEIIDNTIMICFDERKNIYNCLSKVNDKFLIYGIISKNKRSEISTLFYTKPNQIKKKFLDNKNLIVVKKEEFITN
jgi:hypothetical protein